MTNYCKKTISQLKAQISQLQQEKEQLRLLVHELIEVFCKINQKPSFVGDQNKSSSTWTFNPDLTQLFKNFANCKTCSHSQTSNNFTSNGNNFNECGWTQMQDFFTKMKGEHE